MKPTKKTLMICGFVGAVALAGAGVATAATKPNSLASEIAGKFHLNQNDVQQVIDQHHQEEQSFHEQTYEQRLNDAVTDKTNDKVANENLEP